MAKVKLTFGRVTGFKCPADAAQAFLWCDEVPGLAVRATPGSSRNRYIFQSKVNKKTRRITIGDVSVWSIGDAQKEARRLQTIIDQGNDPREVKADQSAAKTAATIAKKAQEDRETVTVGKAWAEYVTARKPLWSELHIRDHEKIMQAGGVQRTRSKKLTEPGSLASFAKIRLVDLTPEMVTGWAKDESKRRPTRARLALRLLRAFLNWCSRHSTYKAIVTNNSAQNVDARESLGKAKVKDDALQREQLPAWFNAVKQIQNPVIAAYLQTLLLTGRRSKDIAGLRWEDIDFQWNSMSVRDKNSVRDKTGGTQIIPLPPYLKHLLTNLPRRNQWVFSSPASASGHLESPADAHNKACTIAGLKLTLHGLRRSLASLAEWIEMPAGIAAQLQGHKPSGVREKHYIRRPLDLLRMWHVKIEAWILEQAGIEFIPTQAGLHAIK